MRKGIKPVGTRRIFSRSCIRITMAAALVSIGFYMSAVLSKYMAGRGSIRLVRDAASGNQAALSESLHTTAPVAPVQSRNVSQTVRQVLAEQILRLSTEQQQEEWDQGLVSFLVGSESCSAVCMGAGFGLVCARDWFAHVDKCSVAKKAFSQEQCDKSSLPEVPLRVRDGGNKPYVLVSADVKNPPTCVARPSAGGERLCPCVPQARARKDGSKGIIAVNKVISKILSEKVKGLAMSGKVGGEEDDVGEMASAAGGIKDLASDRVEFFRGQGGESCEAVCKSQQLRCSAVWFKHINQCEVLLPAFPKGRVGTPFERCDANYYGRDLPGYQSEKDEILLNSDPEGFASTCAGSAKRTQRLCPCVYRYPNEKVTYHTVYSVQSKHYFEWQSRFLHFWHKQVGQPGPITRLLSMGGQWPHKPEPHPYGDHLMRQLPTHLVPEYDPNVDAYSAYNKPLGVTHWLQTTKVEEDVIIILDPDCMILKKIDYPVEEGAPIAAPGYYTFKDPKSYEMQILNHYCKGVCQHFDPIAVPVIIHRKDLEKIAPLWLKYTEDIRRDREGPFQWPIEWNNNKWVVNRIEWVAEMFGYVLAAAHLDLRHEMVDLQMVPGVHKKLDPNIPILHYHIQVETKDKKKWAKGNADAGENLIWPVAAGTDPVITQFLQGLHEASEGLGPTERTKNHKWRGYWDEFLNEGHESEDPHPNIVAPFGTLVERSQPTTVP